MDNRELIVHSILGSMFGFLIGLFLFSQSLVSQLFIGNTFYSVWYKVIPFFTLVGLLFGSSLIIFERRLSGENGK